ncbi:MAG: hypothetical protein J7M25_05075 [Deltaproteobacteria bacterium]|nr:hypothetical protein [Deltaproteobacteria bacterium]
MVLSALAAALSAQAPHSAPQALANAFTRQATPTILLALLISAVALYLLWRYAEAPLLFLFAKRVKMGGDAKAPQPRGPMAEQLEASGFSYLGIRWERLFKLWGRTAAVYVRHNTIIADLPSPSRSEGAYLATFWQDDSCALTKFGSSREVTEPDYHSRAAGSRRVASVLDEHIRTETTVSKGRTPVSVETMDERIRLARAWWERHARSELSLAAAVGTLFLLAAASAWIYGLLVLFGWI